MDVLCWFGSLRQALTGRRKAQTLVALSEFCFCRFCGEIAATSVSFSKIKYCANASTQKQFARRPAGYAVLWTTVARKELFEIRFKIFALLHACLDGDFLYFSISLGLCIRLWMPGADRMCLITLCLQNVSKSFGANCRPLSETSSVHSPYLPNKPQSTKTTSSLVICFIINISGHFEYASTKADNISFFTGSAKSMVILHHGPVAQATTLVVSLLMS